MDQVHNAVDLRHGRVDGGPAGDVDARNGGASSGHGIWALEIIGAHRWWPRRKGKMRWCRRGAHHSTSDSREAARRR
jgi:hypothetical protein